jgi:hypothetical protein
MQIKTGGCRLIDHIRRIELNALSDPLVARFFLAKNAKTWEAIPNDHKTYQTAIKYTKMP